MKNLLLCITAIFSICYGTIASPQDSQVKVSCPERLYGLVNSWAEGFNGTGAAAKASVSVSTGKQLPDISISFVDANNVTPGDDEWAMIVGRDVIVPVINADNPLIGRIRSKGLSPENLSVFIKEPSSASWGTLLGTDDSERAVLYVLDDETLVKSVSGYLGIDVKKQGRTMASDARELFSALGRDPLAIGFCKLANLVNDPGPELAGKIIIAPVDRNGDGAVDHNENIYENLVAFSRGVWIGKYPRALTGAIYAITPVDVTESQAAFLGWILNDGQAYLDKSGFTQLLAGERQSCDDRLAELTSPVSVTNERPAYATLIYVFLTLALSGLLVAFISRIKIKHFSAVAVDTVSQKALDENSLIWPAGLLFDRSHMWSFMEQNGTVKVGIDDYLHHVTGEITRIVLKQKGDFVRKGDEIVSLIRNGKHLTIYSPVSGIIREKNRKLEEDIHVLNTSHYDEGWIYRIEPLSWAAENTLLIMADKYKEVVSAEIHKLREFLAGLMNNERVRYATVVLPDGGPLIDNPLADMGPEIWEEFQIKFIDSAKMH
jgi:glycine cleavage system H lipoate-binding protein/ABC-type phosphate transport system substrate-binding protein